MPNDDDGIVLRAPGSSLGADRAGFLDDPALWQAVFERNFGIPAAGRSMFQSWLANQFGRVATGFELGTQHELEPGLKPQTFEQFLATRPGTSIRDLGPRSRFDRFSALAPGTQREVLERLQTPGAEQFIAESGLRRRFGSTAGQALGAQAFSGPSRRQFQLTPQGLGSGSFLNFLRDRFNF